MRVLLIEDHQPLGRAIKRGLEEFGFVISTAQDADSGDHLVRTGSFDAIVLDLSLAPDDALGRLQQWRRDGIKTHVLILTAQASPEDKVRGLDAGADDCLSKPFELEELRARLGALARRTRQGGQDAVLRVLDLEINLTDRTVRRAGQVIRLTPREFALLHFLAARAGKLVTRAMIWQHLYDDADEKSSNVVDVYIRYLRNKIDRAFAPPLILTRWGEGYMMRDGKDGVE